MGMATEITDAEEKRRTHVIRRKKKQSEMVWRQRPSELNANDENNAKLINLNCLVFCRSVFVFRESHKSTKANEISESMKYVMN